MGEIVNRDSEAIKTVAEAEEKLMALLNETEKVRIAITDGFVTSFCLGMRIRIQATEKLCYDF